MPSRALDWFRQAERDLAQAEASRADARHEWACFASHQAAEKAIKALHLHHGQEAFGHVLTRLIAELPSAVETPSDFVEQARVLDAFYIPTRYPNGHPAGAPFEHFGTIQSEQAIDYARQTVEFVRAALA